MANDFISGGQFTLGPNNSIAIFDNAGEVDWGTQTTISYTSKALTHRLPISLMSGFEYDLIFNKGWDGSLGLQRYKGKLDTYWSILEDQVRAGLIYPRFTIIQTIRESDGSITRATFTDAAITYDDAGSWSNDTAVDQKLSFTAPIRRATNTA